MVDGMVSGKLHGEALAFFYSGGLVLWWFGDGDGDGEFGGLG